MSRRRTRESRRAGRGRTERERRHLAWPLLLALAVVSAVGCDGSGLAVQDIRERGFLRAGYSDEPPYAFRDSTGSVTGESPQALQLAMDALGVEEIRWLRLDFSQLISALEQGRVDVIAAGMYRTAGRRDRVTFTRPTACSGPALVVEAGTRGITGIDAALDEQLRFAVLAGSVEQMALRRLSVPDRRILAAPDVRTGLTAVLDDQADVLAITEPTARWFMLQVGDEALDVVTYDPPAAVSHLLQACSALALRPTDRALAAALDSALADVLESPRRRAMLESFGFSGAEP